VRRSDLKVGAFVLFGLVAVAVVIFLLGDARRIFERRSNYKLSFQDVAGLKKGAPVQMGGVLVGHVTTVDYAKDPADPHIYVTIEVVADAVPRLRSDSKASIANKGFLGDKMLIITKGEKGERLPPGATIPSEEPSDMFAALGDISTDARAAMGNVSRVASQLADERLHNDLRSAVKKLDRLLGEVTEGQGYPHKFLTDPAEAQRISSAIAKLDKSADELAGVLHEGRQIVQQVRTGPGFAHSLLYGEGPNKQIAQFGSAAEEVALTLHAIRTGDGFAHDILFGGKGVAGDALTNLTTITTDIRDIVRGVKQGKGTLGALLVDPSVYEDVKRLLGNVERNAVLRSLVRYSIKQNEKQPPKTMGGVEGDEPSRQKGVEGDEPSRDKLGQQP
jgi:phospholipid/cholesterol/gamma-HCH transport system substrate-binding protein